MNVTNGQYNYNGYPTSYGPTTPAPTTPAPGDSFATSSTLSTLIQQDPTLAAEWQSMTPEQQQEVEQLFNMFGGSNLPPTSPNDGPTGQHYHQDSYNGGPSSYGPTSYGPSSYGPTTYGPTTYGPTTYGPTTYSPATNGPATNGPSGNSGQVYGAQSVNPGDPTITLKNNSSQTRYYYVEASAGADPQHLNGTTIAVPPGGTATVNPGVGFNGAITDNGTNSAPGSHGTRMEYNASTPGQIWYDADTELGNTNATFGATDGKNADDGRSGLVGNNLSHYSTAGAVPGKTESAADKLSDTGTHIISNDSAFTLTST